jgi:deoxyribodipyrimidine photolyase-related protein
MILRFILGDQLNYQHSWFSQKDDDVLYVLMEIRQETDYATHHIQKITAFFMAMREFSEYLTSQGHKVHYIKLDDPYNKQNPDKNLLWLFSEYNITRFEYQEPDEYRLEKQLAGFCRHLDIPSEMCSSEHFFTSRSYLKNYFQGKKQYLMESFYRDMRRKNTILMQDDKTPEGNLWNFDKENRKKLPKNIHIPEPIAFHHNVAHIKDLLNNHKIKTIGLINENDFNWPVNRKESLQTLHFFIEHLLPFFGTYQDAMTEKSWSVFHSRLSFSLNTKMLSPKEVMDSVISKYRENPGMISLSQVEGFVRQILGWLEYMRGIYWAFMPSYKKKNFFNHTRSLPRFYWTGKTHMNCMKHAIDQSLKHAYAHHIQRLMVTGNFALMAGINPDEIDKWYLGIYIDAIQWVEITNTRGMSQFADGGIIATKPYISSANYIHKMSDYCYPCYYDHKKKTGANACPFNSLYWNFYYSNRNKLGKNPRVGMMYRTWDNMSTQKQKELLEQAEKYLNKINDL